WKLSDDGTLTISGTDMPDYRIFYDTDTGQTIAPWYSEREKIKKIVIENGVTSIGQEAFTHCVSLTSITIPNSVTSIGKFAFKGCSELESITIPNSVTSIGDRAFFGCESLTSITIPNSVTSIGNHAFCRCSELESITIPNSVTSIGEGVFFYCYALTSITFEGSTPPEFGKNVFEKVNKSIPVYVPTNCIEEYKEALGDYFEETSIQALQR
ncbi:MAG: leucine-rich repeat domain-containing protein, partial [Paludibacteraceae bacterium]|nr:leucine-rich repeat domain-containing protein [Paludibacteraceae bacterium]